MAFSESYQQGAKALWSAVARDHLAESLTLPDEVMVPPADRDDCIGNEDAPHYDQRLPSRWGGRGDGDGEGEGGRAQSQWGGARSTKSRAGGIFRSARSLAQFRTKVRAPPARVTRAETAASVAAGCRLCRERAERPHA